MRDVRTHTWRWETYVHTSLGDDRRTYTYMYTHMYTHQIINSILEVCWLTLCLSIRRCFNWGSKRSSSGLILIGDWRLPLLQRLHSGFTKPQKSGPKRRQTTSSRTSSCELLWTGNLLLQETISVNLMWTGNLLLQETISVNLMWTGNLLHETISANLMWTGNLLHETISVNLM